MPTWYLVKNRNVIYKATKIVREFHFKEVFARSILGFFVGGIAAMAMYGPGPFSHKLAPKESVKEQREEGVTEEDRQTLEYSVTQKKKYLKKQDFLPGKIRDEE